MWNSNTKTWVMSSVAPQIVMVPPVAPQITMVPSAAPQITMVPPSTAPPLQMIEMPGWQQQQQFQQHSQWQQLSHAQQLPHWQQLPQWQPLQQYNPVLWQLQHQNNMVQFQPQQQQQQPIQNRLSTRLFFPGSEFKSFYLKNKVFSSKSLNHLLNKYMCVIIVYSS